MKRSIVGFLAIILSTQYSFGAPDTSQITSAADATAAINAYQNAANGVIDAASNGTNAVPSDEIGLAKKHVAQIIADANDGKIPSETKTHRSNEKDAHSDTESGEETDAPQDTSDNKESTDAEKAAQEAKMAELEQNYEDAKANEQSTANKLLGATGMATVGIGGMKLASGLAEKKADESAEQDMVAYLSTFTCRYTAGKVSRGGDVGVALPGGNELTPLVAEYKKLAADLKMRKEALGMLPGIESEEILDKATAGLYDDEAIERVDGQYTSLSKALRDKDSEDAAEWAAQKEETSKNIKTGAIMAGVGAAGTAIANLIINRDKSDEKSDETIKKYQKDISKETDKLESGIEKVKTNSKCPTDATGTYPSCKCTDTSNVANLDANSCEAPQDTTKCDDGMVNIDGTCTCPGTHFTEDNECKYLYSVYDATTSLGTVTLSTDNLFTAGKNTLVANAEKELKTFGQKIKSEMKKIDDDIGNSDYCVIVAVGTDRVGDASENETMTGQRAKSIADALGLSGGKMAVMALGESMCTSGDEKTPAEKCRNATITITPLACDITAKEFKDSSFMDKIGVKTGFIGKAQNTNSDDNDTSSLSGLSSAMGALGGADGLKSALQGIGG